jgi:hypothetical protein
LLLSAVNFQGSIRADPGAHSTAFTSIFLVKNNIAVSVFISITFPDGKAIAVAG